MAVFLEAYDKKCKTTLGGIKRAYLFPFEKYTRGQIKSFEMALTAFPPNVFIYPYEVTGNFTQTSNIEEGAFYFDHTVTLKFSEVYNVFDIHKFLKVDVRIIVETYNNQYLLFGVRNGLTGKVTNSSGTNLNDYNGFEVTFTGKEEKSALLVNTLEEFFFIVYDNDGYFNYDLNIDF